MIKKKMIEMKNEIPENWHTVQRLLSIAQVSQITGYSYKRINGLCADGHFPAPIRLTARGTPKWKSLEIAKALGM